MFRIDHLQPRLYVPVYLYDMRTNGYHGLHRGVDWYEAFIRFPKLDYHPRMFLASIPASKGLFYQPKLDNDFIRRVVSFKSYIDTSSGTNTAQMGIYAVTCEDRTSDGVAYLMAESPADPHMTLDEWCEEQQETFLTAHPHLRT